MLTPQRNHYWYRITLWFCATIIGMAGSFAQQVGDHRSYQTGDWSDHTTWEQWDGSNWVQEYNVTYPGSVTIPTDVFPVIAGTNTSAKTNPGNAAHSIALPSGIVTGDLILIFFSEGNANGTDVTIAGYTQLYATETGDRYFSAFYRIADGSEGATVNTNSFMGRSAHVTYRIAAGTYLGLPYFSGTANGTGNSPNPPALAPGMGAQPFLWLAAVHTDEVNTVSTVPANYTDLQNSATSGSNQTGSDHAQMLVAQRFHVAALEDPAAYALGQATTHSARTVGIQGIAAAGTYPHPVIVNWASGAQTGSNAGSHVINIPSGLAGDMLVTVFSVDGGPTVSTVSTGWNKLGQDNEGEVVGAVFWKMASGTASGDDGLTLSTTNTQRSSHVTYRIRGATGISGSSSENSGTNSDPPAHSPAEPGFLWIATRSGDNQTVATAAPANYIGMLTVPGGHAEGASTNTAFRIIDPAAASENPGAFTSASEQWVCWTLAILGPAPVPGTEPIDIPRLDGSLATVHNGHTVFVTGNESVDDLVVENGGLLDIGTGSLIINGTSVVVDGSIAGALGHLILGDINEAAIVVSGSGSMDLFDLTARTPQDVTLEVDLDIRGTLAVRAGDFDATNATVRLVSNLDGTGRLDSLVAGSSYTGVLTMERYIPAGATHWRLLGSAVDGQTLWHWKDDFLTAGFPGSHHPNFDMPVGSGILWPSIRYYDETHLGTNPLDGLTGAGHINDPLSVGMGWAVWCGDTMGTTAAFTIDVTGPPRIAQTPIALPMSWSDSGTPLVDGYNLVSNPLPSPVSFAAIQRGADVENYYWIYSPADGNNATWNGTVGTHGANGIIQSSQGFWLKANGPAVATTVHESAKVLGNSGGVFGGLTMPIPMVRLTLKGNNSFKDEAVVVFQDGTPQLNSGDVPKLSWSSNGAPRIAVRSTEGVNLTIDMYGEYTTDISIPILVQTPSAGTYKVRATDMAGINGLTCLTLEDLVTGTITPLTEGAEYSFTMPASANTSTPRLMLHASAPWPRYSTDALCAGAADGTATVVNTTGVAADVTWMDAEANVLLVQSGVPGVATITGLAGGEYSVTVSSNAGCGDLSSMFSIAEPLTMSATVESIDASCPGATDGALSVMVSGGTAPYTYLWDNGDSGDEITAAAGTYAVLVTDANGCTLQLSEWNIGAGAGPEASFQVDQPMVFVNTAVQFTNTSVGGESQLWDLGDGTSSTELEPLHIYALPGTYTVMLTVFAGECSHSWSMDIVVELSTGLTDLAATEMNAWAADGSLFLEHALEGGTLQVEVLDVAGRLHRQWRMAAAPGRITLPADGLSTGIWMLRVTHGDMQHTYQLPLMR